MCFHSKQDEKYMMQALKLASCGLYTSYPNPAVGCVIVRDGKVIGKGFHHKAGEPHAEIMALTDAGFNAEGATAYVTLEPCSHYGRTPPCALRLIEQKVSRVVVAAGDPNPEVCGRGFKMLQDAGIEVVQHVLEDKAQFQNRAFMKSIISRHPYVTVKTGMSLDAKTALSNGQSKWITSEKSRQKVQDIRAKSDCILTTAATVMADDPRMNVRYETFSSKTLKKIDKKFIRQPLKVVIDSKNVLDVEKYQIFKEGRVLLVNATADTELYLKEEKVNDVVTRLYLPNKDGHVNLDDLLVSLGEIQIRRVMVEAGATLVSALLDLGFVDEIYAFVAPKFLGKGSRDAFVTAPCEDLGKCQHFRLHKVKTYGDDVLMHYLKA